ncbi:Urokinase-type plasminogen activator [Oryzias melastigma]|uniref:trypsin n=1 Tax=Oryzias melastigma TaxID=30732 RepID=A0A3B3B8E5_ORYME|nr:plasminogen activator, urokinase a [Oryzias melastigma]KAF6731423.1 Urokinase-type plasminogen activator [Oryzias melastigma]
MNLLFITSIFMALTVRVAFSQRRSKELMCLSGDGSSYRGMVRRSVNGNRCLNWNRIDHPWGTHTGVGNHKYCRNPNQSMKPWCYVRKGRRISKEFCDVPKCSTSTFMPTVKPTSVPLPVDTEYTCGERNQQRMHKIVGGSFTTVESQPWISAIFLKNRFLCGGSLISPCWVLTAAHCFPDEIDPRAEDLSVFLGKSAINDTDAEREQKFTVEKMIVHPKFNNFNNDIALLKIRSTKGGCAVKTPSVRTVCLPPLHTQLPPGFKCTVAGFGRESFESWDYSQILKQADVNLMSSTECKREPNYQSILTENMLCAASPDWSTDACKGDSGGPLVCQASGRTFLFGVVSWGDGCATENMPGVYTKITNYNKWIAEQTGLTEYTNGSMYPLK